MKSNVWLSRINGVSTSDIFVALNSIGRYHPEHSDVTFGDGVNSVCIDIDAKGPDTFVKVTYHTFTRWDDLSDVEFCIQDFLDSSVTIVERVFGIGHFAGFTYDLLGHGFKAFIHFHDLYAD